MNSQGTEHMAKKTVKAIKVMLNEKKSDPIMMKDKEDLRVDSEGTELETTTMEIETNLKNLKKDKQSNNELENKQAGTLSLDIAGSQFPVNSSSLPRTKTIMMVHKKKQICCSKNSQSRINPVSFPIDTKKSFTVFHQNIRGLRNKNSILL